MVEQVHPKTLQEIELEVTYFLLTSGRKTQPKVFPPAQLIGSNTPSSDEIGRKAQAAE